MPKENKTISEIMHSNISDSIANMIDIQEMATRRDYKNKNIICQEAGKIMESLRELEDYWKEE